MTKTEFIQITQQLKTPLFSYALSLTHSSQDAEDLLQETTIKGLRARHNFLDGSDFRRWMLTIMRNTFINDYRKKKVRRHLNFALSEVTESVIAADPVINTAETNLQLQELHSMLASLGNLYSVPFRMYYKGYTYQEIADYLKLPIGTVKSRIFIARVKMKQLLAKHEITSVAS